MIFSTHRGVADAIQASGVRRIYLQTSAWQGKSFVYFQGISIRCLPIQSGIQNSQRPAYASAFCRGIDVGGAPFEMKKIKSIEEQKAATEYMRRWRAKNSASQFLYRKNYRAKNNGRIKSYEKKNKLVNSARKKRAYAVNILKERERCRAYRAANKSKIYASAKSRPHIARRSSAIRRARKRGVAIGDTMIIKQWERKWRQQKRVLCYWCRRSFQPNKCHTDHIHPLALGGAHKAENLCVSCQPCNNRKHARPLDKWNATLEQPVLL